MGLLILVSGIYFWSGKYNIAATDSHFELVRLGMTTIRDRSIGLRAGEMAVHRIESATAMAGFPPYHGLCSICHAAPGLEASPIRQGLNPKPPLLNSESVQLRSDAELFWILKHGIKMTACPHLDRLMMTMSYGKSSRLCGSFHASMKRNIYRW